jgi:hypothetical protein
MTAPFREGLVMAVRAARTEGERESREEVAHGLRHAKVRVTSLLAEPDLTLDGNRDYPVEDDTPLPHLPPAGCSLFQARPHLFDPREQAPVPPTKYRPASGSAKPWLPGLAGLVAVAWVPPPGLPWK